MLQHSIGNMELGNFPSSEVIWRKEDLRQLSNATGRQTIVRALKIGKPAIFGTLEELIATADAHFNRVAKLTSAEVVTRHEIGISKIPVQDLSQFEIDAHSNPYLDDGFALAAKVDIISNELWIPQTALSTLIQGASVYLRETQSGIFWGDFTKGERFLPPFAARDQFTYGYGPHDNNPKLYLTDIDPILFENNFHYE